MASIQRRGKVFSCIFYWERKRHWFTIGAVSERVAERRADQAEDLLLQIKLGRVSIPDGVDVCEFVKHDGKPPSKPASTPVATLSMLRDRYLAAHEGSHEPSTLLTSRIHFKHLAKTLGENFDLSGLSLSKLQSHLDARGKQDVAPTTIRKEIATFRAAWNWSRSRGFVPGEFPGRGLLYRRTKEKPPFATLAEIRRKIARGGLSDDAQAELWDACYLTGDELPELLAFVKANARHAWIYPMVTMAAHTGARRSEMLRSEIDDVNFDDGIITVREKKRVKGTDTTRRVPMSPLLAEVLKTWIAAHPGGNKLFCRTAPIARSRTRRDVGAPLTRNEAHDHLQRTLKDSPWEQIRGYHVLRHSFVSVCAAKGVDQRFIAEWAGHQTPEQQRRYRHLAPSVQKAVLASVFKGK